MRIIVLLYRELCIPCTLFSLYNKINIAYYNLYNFCKSTLYRKDLLYAFFLQIRDICIIILTIEFCI